MKRLLFVLVFTGLAACGGADPQELSGSDQNLAETLAELIVHREHFGRPASADSEALYRARVDSILQARGFTREEFVESFVDLATSPDRLDPLFKRVFSDLQQSAP